MYEKMKFITSVIQRKIKQSVPTPFGREHEGYPEEFDVWLFFHHLGMKPTIENIKKYCENGELKKEYQDDVTAILRGMGLR